MQPNTMRTLAEYIADKQRRNRDNYRATSGSSFDTTIEDNTSGDQGNRSGNGGRNQNNSGQSWD